MHYIIAQFWLAMEGKSRNLMMLENAKYVEEHQENLVAKWEYGISEMPSWMNRI